MAWQRLSVRDGQSEDDGPYDGVPDHLYQPLREWVAHTFGGNPGSLADAEGGPLLSSAIRRMVIPPRGHSLTVRSVTESFYPYEPDAMLDVVDAVLHLKEVDSSARKALDNVLLLGGSVWRVDPDGHRLTRRVDTTATASFVEATLPSDMASVELKKAWTAAYGRSPNASDAWDHSIKAVEASLIPVVTPNKTKATLGDVVGILNSQGSIWKLGLHGHDGSQSVDPMVAMLRLIWPNPDRHGSDASREPSLAEAQGVIHLAISVVQLARCDLLFRRRQP
ncbi:MAG: hypothetical protein ACRDPY_13160 [Streptosporangiaceae bacterium]